jgi:AcrR family transcriptional regulator
VSRTKSTQVVPDGRRDRWQAHRETRRGELIAAVIAVVSEHGPGVGMDDIAAASGIAKPVFYRYFSDKSDLFLAVGRAVAESVVADTTAAIDRASSPRAKLEAGIDAYVARIEANPGLYRFAAAPPATGRSAGGDPLDDYASVMGLHASRVIGQLARAAGMDSGAAEPWGFGIVGLVRSATDRWLDNPTMSRAALVGYLTNLVWPGLKKTAQSPAGSPSRNESAPGGDPGDLQASVDRAAGR